MALKYFIIDTCIWRDFYEARFSKSGRPLGKYASEFFMKILKQNHKIYFSESLVRELKKDYTSREINDLLIFLSLSKQLLKIDITKEEFVEARDLSTQRKIPFVDCLNAIHARDYNATLVSQDMHILRDLKDIAKAIRPEELK